MQTISLLLALGVASFTVAEWTFPSQLSLDNGMFGGDTTWYHMPFAARIAQEGSTVHLHFTDPLRLAAWFYPQSSELVHAAGIVLFKSDWLSPLINLAWLSIALLAAWCVGRPYKVGPATLVAGAIVLDAGVMIETQPGEGRNDIMGLAFLLAFAAFLINGHQRRAPAEGAAVQDAPERDAPLLDKGPLVIAGIAAGLAASVKYTFLIPVVAITLGVVIFSGKGRRLTTAWVLGLSAFVVGGYWYVRAMIKTGGNPIPYSGFGPLHLPQPDQMPLDPRPRFAVADYLTDPTIYRKWFFPRLDNAFGPLWPLILIVAVAAAVFLVVRSRNRILQVLAAAALLTAVVYVFTPLTAAGQEGSPTGFFTNTRYLVPGLVLAMTLLPIARPLRAPDARARQTLLFLLGGLRDHRADDAALVPGLHLRHDLPHPLPGLGAGRPRPAARAQRRVSRGQVAVGPRRRAACWRSSSAAPRRSSTSSTTTPKSTTSSRTAARRRPTGSPAASTTSGSGSPAPARSSSASTATTARTSTTTSSTSASPGDERHLPPGDDLPAVPPPDQRRRLRLPDPQPVHDGRARPVPAPGLRLGQERPGGGADHRRDRHRRRSPTTSSRSTASSTRPAASRLAPAEAQTAASACSRISSAERSRLLPPEHVADVLEQLERGRDQPRDQLAVGDLDQPVGGAVDDQGRHREPARAARWCRVRRRRASAA